MNRKSGPIALNWRRKSSHFKSREFSSKTPTKNRLRALALQSYDRWFDSRDWQLFEKNIKKYYKYLYFLQVYISNNLEILHERPC